MAGEHVGKEVVGNIMDLTNVLRQRFACSTEEIWGRSESRQTVTDPDLNPGFSHAI